MNSLNVESSRVQCPDLVCSVPVPGCDCSTLRGCPSVVVFNDPEGYDVDCFPPTSTPLKLWKKLNEIISALD